MFLTRHGTPKLARCAVLFLDLLGVEAMSKGPLSEVRADLVALDRAIRGMSRDYLLPGSGWPASLFSDTLVLAAPIEDPSDDAPAVLDLVYQAAALQLNLYAQGFFARGGLTVGWFHIRDGVVFGPALVDAYQLERKHAVYPRIILAPDLDTTLRDHLYGRGNSNHAGEGSLLCCDRDGWTFIDYLDLLNEDVDELEPQIMLHREVVTEQLSRHQADKRVWEKYRWVAEYHNAFVCRGELQNQDHCLVGPDDTAWQFAQFGRDSAWPG